MLLFTSEAHAREMQHYECKVSWNMLLNEECLIQFLNWLTVPTCGMQKRFRNVEEINLEFAQDVEDKHLTAIASKV